jgi:exopolysaccharide production protein ExoQ
MSTVALTTFRTTSAGASWAARCAAAAVVVMSFWFVGHSLNESKVIADEVELGPDRAENRVAVQAAETTTSSAVGYFLLGGVGGAILLSTPLGRIRWNYGLLLLCAIYTGWCATSILWSTDPMQSFRKISIVALVMAAALAAAAKFELEDLAWVMVLSLTFFVGLGVLAEAAHGTLRPWKSLYRFCGTVHPNDQGVQCAMLALAAAFAVPQRLERRWWMRALFALALGGLWFTKSRTTLAAFLVAAAVGLIMKSRGVQRWLVLSTCLTLMCLGGIASSFVSVSSVDETASVAAMGRTKDVNSLTGRLPLWEELWKAVHKRPMLGYGFGGFWDGKNTLKYSEMLHWHIPHGHNSYLDIILNTGAVGLVLYLAWLLATIAVCVVRYERHGRSGQLFALCLCVFAIVHGVSESKFPGTGLGGMALLTVMLMVAVERPEQASARSKPPRGNWMRRLPSLPTDRRTARFALARSPVRRPVR